MSFESMTMPRSTEAVESIDTKLFLSDHINTLIEGIDTRTEILHSTVDGDERTKLNAEIQDLKEQITETVQNYVNAFIDQPTDELPSQLPDWILYNNQSKYADYTDTKANFLKFYEAIASHVGSPEGQQAYRLSHNVESELKLARLNQLYQAMRNILPPSEQH